MHTSLCLQAEMDMITTDEVRRENGGSDTNAGTGISPGRS